MKILIADDDLISRTVLIRTLTKLGYEVIVTTDGEAALKGLLEPDAPTLAILDWEMPGLDGSQVCESLRRRQREKYTYIILVTAKAQKADVIRGLEAGADDYLIKPYDPLELKARLIAGRRVLDVQEQLIAAREMMRHQATRDFLTGVWNHRAIMEILDRELSRSRREARPLGVVLGDLDHFKQINDTFGHLGGDAVLKEVATRMNQAIRPYDLVGRYGGEEFLIVLPGCDQAVSLKIGERLRDRIATEPVRHHGQTIPVTISLGVVVYDPPVPVDPHALLQSADGALYHAKDAGRNRVEMCEELVGNHW